MARVKPNIEAPETIEVRKDQEYITQVREYRLITPLFGGGVDPGEADPVTVVRASEIRGQLRFWWRATRGGQFGGKLEDIKAAEDALWGAASKKEYERPSLVQVEVHQADSGRSEIVYAVNRYTPNGQLAADHQRRSQTPPYISFPLQPRREETVMGWKSRPVLLNVTFMMTLRFPAKTILDGKELDIRQEVNTACRVWELFGGIGARTRRGFGALCIEKINDEVYQDLPPSHSQKCETWIQGILDGFTGSWERNIPHLSPTVSFAITKEANSPTDVWHELIDLFKSFRGQVEETPFRKRDMRAIQRLVGRNPSTESVTDFQRAKLGLPLIYQNLKGIYSPMGQVKSVTLQGKSKDKQRFASPLILKPIACKEGKYVGLALLLTGSSLPDELTLDGYDVTIKTNESINLDVAEAFIKSLKESI